MDLIHIDIDGALFMANRQPKRSVMVLFPDIWAEEERMHLQNSRLNSAILPEFQQTTDELTLFSAQCSRTELHQHGEYLPESAGDYLTWLETLEFLRSLACHL